SERRTDSADRSETSCSPERPPKITPTRIFFILLVLSHHFANRSDGILDVRPIDIEVRHHPNPVGIDRNSENLSFRQCGQKISGRKACTLDAVNHNVGL